MPSGGDWAGWIARAVDDAKRAANEKGRRDGLLAGYEQGRKYGRRVGLNEAARVAERHQPADQIDILKEGSLMRESIVDAIRDRLNRPKRRV